MRGLADAMPDKLGHQDHNSSEMSYTAGMVACVGSRSQVAKGMQVGIVVSFDLGKVCAVEYDEDVTKG